MIKRPMKGAQLEDLELLRYPLYASPKIDGFRCVLADQPLTSRLSPFPNEYFRNEMSKLLSDAMLDSEVVVGRRRGPGVLQRTSSGLTGRAGNPSFRLWVFDRPGLGSGYGWLERYDIAADIVRKLDHPRINLLKHKLITNPEQMQKYIERQLARGFEGVMTRDPNGPYKEGKSTLREQYLLKIKPFTDFEARITGWYEEMENTNEAKRETTGKLRRSSSKVGKVGKGTLGGFEGTELGTGKPVRVGGGFSAEQRRRFWLIKDELVASGAIMKCRKQLVGEKDAPRHPTFDSLRPEWDITALDD